MTSVNVQRLAVPALGLIVAALAALVPQLAVRIAFEMTVVAATAFGTWRAFVLTSASSPASGEASPALAPVEVAAYRRDRRNPIVDRESGLFVDWYMRLRLEEEIARAARFGERFCVAVVSAEPSTKAAMLPALKASLRKVDYAADLGTAVAVVLPNTDRSGAEIWRSRLPAGAPVAHLAEYPADGKTVNAMLGEEQWAFRPDDTRAA
jgi:hypothetical protein